MVPVVILILEGTSGILDSDLSSYYLSFIRFIWKDVVILTWRFYDLFTMDWAHQDSGWAPRES